jgi:hypothetical protein
MAGSKDEKELPLVAAPGGGSEDEDEDASNGNKDD